ncbi:hypothetical protein [Streptomyces sp. A5-4]|uniref:hypothetical protein n=1 Tax=Streptomyces sp. A5-4 TaxID=3384771 RepID=UPI003DA9857C
MSVSRSRRRDSWRRARSRYWSGLGTPANLRRHFQRLTGTSPSTYRTAFRSLVAELTWSERADTEDAKDTRDPRDPKDPKDTDSMGSTKDTEGTGPS